MTVVSVLREWATFPMNRSARYSVFCFVNANQINLKGRAGTFALVALFSAITAVLYLSSGTAGAAASGVTCAGQTPTHIGTSGPDTLRGTSGPDVIVGLGGNDAIYGLGGNDVICAGSGHDRVFAGAGNDVVHAFRGSDIVSGGSGNDRIIGGTGADELRGGPGTDVLLGGAGRDALYGNSGGDLLRGGKGVDTLDGGLGVDTYRGGLTVDTFADVSGTEVCLTSSGARGTCGGVAVAATLSSSNSPSIAAFEAEMLRLINIERAKVPGLTPLTRDTALNAYARDWATVMSQQPLPLHRDRHHSPAFTGSNISFQSIPNTEPWTHAFENVGYTEIATNESVASVMNRLFYNGGGRGFTSSPGHQCNILETAADEVGLGAFVDADGSLWVAQVFWGSNAGSAPAPVASCQSVVSR